MNIRIWTKIYPSEDEDVIQATLTNLFPAIKFTRSDDNIEGSTEELNDLKMLKELIETHAIRDTARLVMGRSIEGNSVTFYLNKQVAAIGKINFSKDSPLGPIIVRIVGNPTRTIDYLAPSTIY